MQAGPGERIGVPLYLARHGSAVGQSARACPVGVVSGRRPVVGLFVPHGRVDLRVSCRELILLFQRVVGYGVNKSGSNDADSRLEAHRVVGWHGVSVEGRGVDGHLGVNQFVRVAAVGERHRQSALHCRDVLPGYCYLVFVDRWQERRYCLCLRHARHLADVWAVVAVCPVVGMVYHEQVAIAEAGLVGVLPLSVAVARVAVNARLAHRGRAEPVEGWRVDGDIALKEHLAAVELVGQSHVGCGRGLVFIASFRHVERCAQLSSGIPFVGREVAHGLSDVRHIVDSAGLSASCRGGVVGACRHRQADASGQELNVSCLVQIHNRIF